MWCIKSLWSLDCGCSGGGVPRPSFLLHDSRSRRVPLPDQLPFLWGPFLTLEPKAATSLVLPLVFPSIPQWLMASVSWILRSSAFWLIQRTVTGGCLPSSPFRFIYTTDVSVRYWAHKRPLGLAGRTQHPSLSNRCLLLSELDFLGKKHCLQHYIIGSVPGM